MSQVHYKLERQVEPPRRRDTGITVIAVASAAMFFAVASSALMLRARMAHVRAVITVIPAEVHVIQPPAASAPCGQPHMRDNPDGTRTVVFDTCMRPSYVPTMRGATPLPRHTQLAVPPLPSP